MKFTIFFLLAYFILYPFGQLTRLPTMAKGLPEVNLYLADLLVVLVVVSWGVGKLKARKKIVFPSLARPILAFGLIALLSLLVGAPLFAGREVLVALLYLGRWWAYTGLYFVFIDLKKAAGPLKTRSWSLYRIFLAIGGVLAVFGLTQYVFWPNLRPLAELNWDPHYFRLVGTFLDPGFTGLIYALALILLVVYYWPVFLSKKRVERWPFWLFGLIYLALALTYSRASYLAYLVGMGAIAGVKRSLKFFLVVFALGLVTILVLPRPQGEGGSLGRWYSIEARIQNWRNSLKIAADHPLLGVGFNTYRYVQRNYGFLEEESWQESHSGAGADSSLLFVLATTGLIGISAYLWLIWSILRLAWSKLKTPEGLFALSGLIACLSHAFFLNSLFYPWVMAWWWFMATATESK